MIKELNDKLKYTLTHKKNCPWLGVHFRTHTGAIIVENYKLIDSINGHISIYKHLEEKNLKLALDELDKHINSWHDDRMLKSLLMS